MFEKDRDRNSIPEMRLLREHLANAYSREESVASGQTARRSRRRRAGAVSVAVVAVCVVSAIVISDGGGKGADPLAPLSTKQALASVARKSLSLPQPGPRQFIYSRTKYTFGSSAGAGGDLRGKRISGYNSLIDVEAETWSSRDLCGLSINRILERRFPTERDRVNAERFDAVQRQFMEETARKRKARGQKPIDSPLDWNQPGAEYVMRLEPAGEPKLRIGRERLTARELRNFPTDPAAIYRRVHRATRGRPSGFAGGGAVGEWLTITDVLASTQIVLQPTVRAGFVNALAYVPGVRSLGGEIDSEGRAGVGFELVLRGIRNHVIFEAESGVPVFGERQIVSSAGRRRNHNWPVGTVLNKQLLLQRSVADAPPKDKKIDIRLSGFDSCPK